MWDGIYLLHPTSPILALLLALLYLIWIELRRAREARGWTAEEAAERLGVDSRTYSSWERGEHEPRALNRLALARTFLKTEARFIHLSCHGEFSPTYQSSLINKGGNHTLKLTLLDMDRDVNHRLNLIQFDACQSALLQE